MPENDYRTILVLHESEVGDFDDAWHLGDYGDGWGQYAILTDDPARDVPRKSAPRNTRSTQDRSALSYQL